jgi:hypothetical protein
LASGVNANISSLENLSASLADTIPMLDRLQSENSNSIRQTQEKIDLVLDEYTSRMNTACDRYQKALSDLRYAEQYYEVVPYYFYEAVNETEHEYNRLSFCCDKIKTIKANFIQLSTDLFKALIENADNYSSVVNKGNSFLGKYIELLSRSISAISGSSVSPISRNSIPNVTGVNTNVQSVQSIGGWLGNINPYYIGSPDSQYSWNCGSCAFAVESRLSGKNNAAIAGATNISTDAEMEQATGKKCVYMPMQNIEEHLKNQGAGSHLIVGINRQPYLGIPRPGHWFNAYYDGKNIYTIDGQSGSVYSWPHDYGSISAWCALI